MLPSYGVALITLDAEELEQLRRLVNDDFVSEKVRKRASIIFLAEEYTSIRQMCEHVGDCDPRTVGKWLKRYKKAGIEGLNDLPRGGHNRLSLQKRKAIIRSTRWEKPSSGRRWTTRSMAQKHGVSRSTVQRIWYEEGLRSSKKTEKSWGKALKKQP